LTFASIGLRRQAPKDRRQSLFVEPALGDGHRRIIENVRGMIDRNSVQIKERRRRYQGRPLVTVDESDESERQIRTIRQA
jgi:hypothetical protein